MGLVPAAFDASQEHAGLGLGVGVQMPEPWGGFALAVLAGELQLVSEDRLTVWRGPRGAE